MDKQQKTPRSQPVHSHVPYGNQGDVYYSKAVKTAYKYHDEMWPLVENALDDIASNSSKDQSIVVANFGAADGGVSLPLMGKIVNKIRQLCGQEKEIAIWYEDQPTNDFVGLFQILTGQTDIGTELSYFCKDDKVFVSACGISFYMQCFPSRSIDLVLSSTAFHWLKDPPPRNINDFCKLDNESEEIKKMSEKDWETILLHRAKEMKSGAWMILAELAITDDGIFTGRTKNIKMFLQGTLYDCWRDLHHKGLITKEEYEKLVLAVCFRSYDEHRKPFSDPSSKASMAGLRLISMETKLTRCAFHSELVENPTMDPNDYAKRFTKILRAWGSYTFFAAFSKERSKEERNSIIDTMFEQYENIVASSPLDHGCDYVHRYIVSRKTDRDIHMI